MMAAADYPIRPCPKCGAVLEAVGEVEIEGRGGPWPCYLCENEACAGSFEMEGQRIPCLYSFTVLDDGEVVEIPMS